MRAREDEYRTPLRSSVKVDHSNRTGHATRLFVGIALVIAIVAAYHNSFSVPFVFDDPLAITENPTIRKLWPLTDVLLPPGGEGHTVEGRPVLNLTLALNYASGGTSVRGYHVVNLIVHTLASLALFGLTRRALQLPRLRDRFGDAALPIAAIVALLWALHPLQTESVTYVVQRAESLVGLFYLLTLYCFVRGVEQQAPRSSRGEEAGVETFRVPKPDSLVTSAATKRWFSASLLSCLVGMATKEVMVSAPLLVLLFDRIFVADSFREAWQRRRGVHVGLFSTWALLAALVLSTGTRGGTAGFGINVTPWAYALTQFESVTRYVWLSFWPHPLVLDYGAEWVQSAAHVLPYAMVLFALIGGTIVAWWRWPSVAFLGLLFFAVLSPTSSIVPGNRQTIAEHRMYLPLAAVVVFAVCAIHLASREAAMRRRLFGGGVLIAVAFGFLTTRRNDDYRSVLTLYGDTVEKRPRNGFAHYNLAKVYAETGRHREAVVEYEQSLRLMPGIAPVHNNLGNSLAALGRINEARAQFETALRIDPNYTNAHFNLGNLLLRGGDKEIASEHFRRVVSLEPQHLEAQTNLGGVLLELGRLDEAREQFEQVLQGQPDSVEAHFGLGNAFLLQRRWPEATREFEAVLRLRPDMNVARERLALARGKVGR